MGENSKKNSYPKKLKNPENLTIAILKTQQHFDLPIPPCLAFSHLCHYLQAVGLLDFLKNFFISHLFGFLLFSVYFRRLSVVSFIPVYCGQYYTKYQKYINNKRMNFDVETQMAKIKNRGSKMLRSLQTLALKLV